MEDLIEVRVYNGNRKLQYSFLIICEMDSLSFREIIDETLANGYDGWSCEANLLEESDDTYVWSHDPLNLGC